MKVYLDNAATTMVDKEVIKAMLPYLDKKIGNPSSIHSFGREAKIAIESSREKIMQKLGAKNGKLIFTSGGTESNNLAIKGVAFSCKGKGKHIITTGIEHKSVLEVVDWLKKYMGFKVTYLPVDHYGFINLEKLENSITKDTILVSIIHGNNEIGTIQNIKEIGKICNDKDVYLHTDACQSFTKTELDVEKMYIDMVSINSHKIHGPKGVGALYISEKVKITPLLHGGGQEHEIRGGTENVPGIVGFAKATEVISEKDIERMEKLRDKLISGVLKEIVDSKLNGHPKLRLCNIANFTFKDVEGESLLMRLDMHGIACSTGSACSSRSLKPSHVLLAIGLKLEEAHGSLRMSLSKYTTSEEISYTLEKLKNEVEELRKISPRL